MKYPQFDEISGTPNNIISISDMRNIGYCNGKWWWAESTGASNQVDLKIYSATSLTATPVLEHTESYTDTTHGSTFTFGEVYEVMLRTVGSNIMAMISFQINDGSDKVIVYGTYSTDSGSSFSISGYIHKLFGNSHYLKLGDCIYLNSYPRYILIDTSSEVVRINSFDGTVLSPFNYDSAGDFYPGLIISNNYWFVYKKQSDSKWYVAYHDGTYGSEQQTDYEEISFTEATNKNIQKQIFWKVGGSYYLIDQDYIRIKSAGNWSEKSAVNPPANVCYVFSQDQEDINYIIWDNGIWKMDHGMIGKIQEYSGNAITGYIDWFSNGSDAIYQIIYEELSEIRKFQVFTKLYTPNYAELICQTEPFDEQYIELYSDDEELLIADYIAEYETNGQEYRWLIGPHPDALVKTGAQYIDLNAKVTASFTDKTLHYILKYIIDNFCTFLWYDAGIDTTPSDTYTISFKDKTVLQCMKWIDQQQGYQTSIRPNHEVYWDEYTQADWDYKKGVAGVVDWGTAANPDYTTNIVEYNLNNGYIQVEDVDDHKNAMVIYDPDSSSYGGFRINFDSPYPTSGTIEFWWKRTSGNVVFFRLYDQSGNEAILMYLDHSSGQGYYDHSTSSYVWINPRQTMNTWSHYKITFDLSTGLYSVWKDGVAQVTDLGTRSASTEVRNLRLFTWSDGGGGCVFDAIGFSWDGYTARSLLWTPTLDTDCTATVTSVGGRDRVIDLYDNNNAGFSQIIAPVSMSSGTIIFYFRTDDVTLRSHLYILDGNESNALIIYIDDSTLYYYDGTAHDLGINVSNNIWYKCKIVFNFSSTWSIYINDIEYATGLGYVGTPTTADGIEFRTRYVEYGYHFYVDVVYISGMRDLLGYNEYQLSDHVGPLYAPPTQKIQKIKYGRFIVHGGYVNGQRLKSENIIEPNFSTFIEEEPSITDQTALDDYRQSLENTKNTVIKKYKINLGSRFPLLPGEQIWMWLADQYSVYKEVGYVIESRYDGFQKESQMIIADQIWQPPLKESTDSKVNNVEQNVAAVEKNTNSSEGNGITPSIVIADSDDNYAANPNVETDPDTSTWTTSSCTLSVEDKSNHKNTIKFDISAAGGYAYKSFSAADELWVSFHIYRAETNQRFTISIMNSDRSVNCAYVDMQTDGTVDAGSDSDSKTEIATYTTGWTHYVIRFQKNDTSEIYQDGFLRASFTGQNTDAYNLKITSVGGTDCWIDAVYIGTDKNDAFSTMADGIVQSQHIVTRRITGALRSRETINIFIEENLRNNNEHIYGMLVSLTSGSALNSSTPINTTGGCHRIMIVINSATDAAGTITVTGTTRDRTDTSTSTGSDTEDITISGVSTDGSSTDAEGNPIHSFSNVYITDKWFEGAITISTTNVALSDVDVYGILYHQFDDYYSVMLETYDLTAYCTNASAWLYNYMYLVIHNGNKKYDIDNIVSHEIPAGTTVANMGYRRRKKIRRVIDCSDGEGVWFSLFLGPSSSTYWVDVAAYLTVLIDGEDPHDGD